MKSLVDSIEDSTPQGIAAAIARMITSGDLASGDRLPTVRELASDLSVSPATVSHAWKTLSSAGLIISRGRSGSFVRSTPREWLPRRYQGLDGQHSARLDLSRGTPDSDLLPALGPALSRVSARAATSSYQQKPDIPELHDHLRATWPSPVESITVVNGALDGIDRVLSTIARYGDRVIVENPTFPPFMDLLDHYGLDPVPVELDRRGMRPDSLAAALGRHPTAVIIQPRAHNPTGISMDMERAHELAVLLRRSRTAENCVVVEDDHSGDIASADSVTLANWLPERVLHVRSFSKSHGPDLRIGALGGPRPLVDRVVARRLLGPGWTSRMVQALLFELLTHPESIEEIARARARYAERQLSFADELGRRGVTVAVGDGINAWLPVPSERAAIVQLAAAGILVAPGTPFSLGESRSDFVRVTVGVVGDEMTAVTDALAAVARP